MLADDAIGSSAQRIKNNEAPSLVPDRPIDFDRLTRLSGGDQKTMREVLQVFNLQADLLLARMASEEPRAAAARGHTLAVCAHSVGAWKVEACATRFEQIALESGPIALNPIMRRLAAIVTEAQGAIGSFLSDASLDQADTDRPVM